MVFIVVINFFAGAGAGKSTISADVFSQLKKMNYNCEMVGEYAKELILSNNYEALKDQIYLFAEQLHRLRSMDNRGVKIVVCDSPLLLSLIYDKNHEGKEFSDLVWKEHNKYENFNYFLERVEDFWKIDGRLGTKEIAKQNDMKILGLIGNLQYKKITPFDSDMVVGDINERFC